MCVNQLMEHPMKSTSSAVSTLTTIAASQEKTVTITDCRTIPRDGTSTHSKE